MQTKICKTGVFYCDFNKNIFDGKKSNDLCVESALQFCNKTAL